MLQLEQGLPVRDGRMDPEGRVTGMFCVLREGVAVSGGQPSRLTWG